MEDIYLRQLAVGPMQNFAYLIGAVHGAECAVIDPGWDATALPDPGTVKGACCGYW